MPDRWGFTFGAIEDHYMGAGANFPTAMPLQDKDAVNFMAQAHVMWTAAGDPAHVQLMQIKNAREFALELGVHLRAVIPAPVTREPIVIEHTDPIGPPPPDAEFDPEKAAKTFALFDPITQIVLMAGLLAAIYMLRDRIPLLRRLVKNGAEKPTQ